MAEPSEQTNQNLNHFVYEPPTSQEYQFKIYINQCDSFIGSELVQQFRNDHIIEANPNIIIGSTSNPDTNSPLPSGVNHIIDINNQRLYNSVLIQSDIILFTLTQSNIQQFEYLLKLLKNSHLQQQKRVICISSFISWGKGSNHSLKATKDTLYLRNTLDYHVKTLESLCLNLSNQNEKLKGSVIFSGLIYGLGEDILFPYFKRALEQQKPLEIFGKGTNYLPTIHLKDLAQIVHNITFRKFQKGKNWHFACDSSNITQKQLIKIIAENLGNGSVVQNPIEECFISDLFDYFTMNVQVQESEKESLQCWHCKDGLKSRIQTIVSEFNQYRGLKPNKIFITGPPLSGKSTIAEILKKNYGLPIITIKSLITDIKQDDSQFGKQIQRILEQIRVQKVQQQRKAYEEMKKKKKSKGVEQFDQSKVVPRLPDEHLKRLIRWRLNFADCLNKGYILDSVVKTYKVAEGVFVNQQGVIDDKLMPNSMFLIKATDQQIKERLKTIPAEKTQNTHWTEEQTVRRLQTYSKQNEQKPLMSFFQNKVDIRDVEISYEDPSVFSKFIERNGPLGFKKQHVQQTVVQQQKQNNEQANNDKNEEDNEDENNEDDNEQQIRQEFNLDKLTEKQQKILNEKSRPIRQYLIDNVIPQITQGLLQICKQVPEDPIQFLIGFLENKNLKKQK